MRLPHTLATIVATAICAGAGVAGAQKSAPSSSALAVGDNIRLRTAVYDTVGSPVTCAGSVASISGDTAVLNGANEHRFLRPSLSCPSHVFAPGEITALTVVRGDRGSRLRHAGLGALGGALVGGVVGRIADYRHCNQKYCSSDDREAGGIITMLLIGAGAIVGGTVGLALPAGKQWERVENIPPLRIARFTLRPG
ncbi:MAG: hypothetical protein ACR2M1_09515, partial [Gemmatimonadaceae bacterium]